MPLDVVAKVWGGAGCREAGALDEKTERPALGGSSEWVLKSSRIKAGAELEKATVSQQQSSPGSQGQTPELVEDRTRRHMGVPTW